jgi:signal transduction histidine kinase/CheY-like chemotaxis protein
VWIVDVAEDPNFPRAREAKAAGLTSAFAFPVVSRGEVTAVLEFFSPHALAPPEGLLARMANIGSQLGQIDYLAARERADQAKSEFLSRMSHELRTPLNSIIGFARLLEFNELDDARREYVGYILKGGHHLLELINEILDISRVEAGTLGISLEPVDVDAAVAHALELIRPMAAERGLRINGASGASPARYAAADQQRMNQILLNLLSNAVKYNREGGEITVSVEERGKRIRIVVADTGIGLTPGQVQQLFVAFQRLGAEGAMPEGAGLGLSLSKRLAEAMNGTLEAQSERGVGSTFALELDREETPIVGDRSTGKGDEYEIPLAIADHPIGPPADDSPKVLYIEDNLSSLRLVREIFALRPGVELLVAMQGTLGIELAGRHHPDLILVDLHLPDMPGRTVLARLRSNPATAAIPVAILSADATKGQMERLLAAGAEAYLTKPLDVRRFLELIDEHLSRC